MQNGKLAEIRNVGMRVYFSILLCALTCYGNTSASINDAACRALRDVWTSRFKGNKNGACTGSGTCHVGIFSDEGYFHNNPLGDRPIYNGLGLALGYKFKYAFRPR